MWSEVGRCQGSPQHSLLGGTIRGRQAAGAPVLVHVASSQQYERLPGTGRRVPACREGHQQ